MVVNYRRDDEAAKDTVAQIESLGGTALAVQADVAETDSVESLVDQSVERFGSLDVVVANAAASAFKPLSEIYGRHIDKTMSLTVQGFLDLVRLATPHMNDGGRVMAVSGWDSFRVLPGHALLGAAKAAMETLVKYLAIELAKDKITTVGVCPGPIDTDSFRYYAGEAWEDYAKQWLAQTPVGCLPDARRGRGRHGLPRLAGERCDQRPDDRGRRWSVARDDADRLRAGLNVANSSSAVAQTVVQLMRQVERRPARDVAVEEAGGGRRLTIGALAEDSNRLANAFVGLGLGPGDRVAYVAQNHLEYVVLEFALLKAGLVKVPLNPRFTPHELQRCIELADVRLIVADTDSAAAIDEVFADGGLLRTVIGARDGWLSFAELVVGRLGGARRCQRQTR